MQTLRSLFLAGLFLTLLTSSGQTAANGTAVIRVLSPGVVYNAGLLDLAASFTRKTGIKVYVLPDLMGKIMGDIKTRTPPPDVIFLPMDLMSSLALDDGIVPGTFTPLGRVEIGLAVKEGAPHPDISTVDKLVAALKNARQVMVSDPAGGMSLEAGIIDGLLKRPEFAGIHAVVSTNGEGGQALARGEGDMALQLVCEITPYPQISLVGALPPELDAHIDNAAAVAAHAVNVKDAKAFIRYITRSEAAGVWKAKGLNRY
ncbi:MAG TPA: substrate-binding domain-containing protein [Rhizomicrobium sp.]|nr:substrate-binding domain-containing protein [Rhizomicrobium sp.]